MTELNRALRRLPHAEREALALCVWSEVSYADAATALNKDESTVRSLVSRGRARLVHELGESDEQSNPASGRIRRPIEEL